MSIEYEEARPTGGAAPVSVTCTPASGMPFPVGASTVTCTVYDALSQTASCSFDVAVAAVPRLLKTRFMAFGDSLTEGKLSSLARRLLDAGPHSYPSQLQRLLDELYAGQAAPVINEGHGGERADESLPRYTEALSIHQPDAVLLMHGVNDLNGPTMGRVRATADVIEELTKRARSAGVTPLVATLPPMGPGPKAGCPECVEPLNELIRSMVAAKGAVLVDVYAAWGDRPGLMGADGIHPTEAGYQVIAETFLAAISRTFEGAPEGRPSMPRLIAPRSR